MNTVTTHDLERMGKLKRVHAKDISAEIRALGDAKKKTQDGQRMAGFQCELNARALIEAMTEKGENDWHIVFGVAHGDDPLGPVAHVWTRKGDEHFDPTWSIFGPVDRWQYFVLAAEEAVSVNDLHALEDLVGRWKLRR